jgi:hypothetical protein
MDLDFIHKNSPEGEKIIKYCEEAYYSIKGRESHNCMLLSTKKLLLLPESIQVRYGTFTV